MRVSMQKRLAMSLLNCGQRKIWLDPTKLKYIYTVKTREGIRDLIQKGMIVRKWNRKERDPGYYDRVYSRKKCRPANGEKTAAMLSRIRFPPGYVDRINRKRWALEEKRKFESADKVPPPYLSGVIASCNWSSLPRKKKHEILQEKERKREKTRLKGYLKKHKTSVKTLKDLQKARLQPEQKQPLETAKEPKQPQQYEEPKKEPQLNQKPKSTKPKWIQIKKKPKKPKRKVSLNDLD